jgi:hypothetical protein
MSSALQRRIEQLEQRSPVESNRLKIEMGYIQHLPAEFQGPRHLEVRDRLAWNGLGGCLYEWEEVGGPTTKDDEADSPNILRVELVATEPYRLGDARRKREAEAQPAAPNRSPILGASNFPRSGIEVANFQAPDHGGNDPAW